MTVKSASATLLCVQEFVEASFSGTMSVELERGIRNELAVVKPGQGEGQEDVDVPGEHAAALAGLGTIIGTQIAHKLAQKIAQGILGKVITRILGKAASSVIPIAGWIVGGVLIIYDLYQAWDGSLPKIQKDFKSEKVKETIREGIAKLLEEELRNSLPEISDSVTIDIFKKWKAFLQEFELVLRLAESNERFREIVDGVTVEQVNHLTELATVGHTALGKEWLIRTIESGEFERIFELPEHAIQILRDEADPRLVLAWADLAGEQIVDVVKLELYIHAEPTDFVDRESVAHVLALDDSAVIEKLMNLENIIRNTLLRLPTSQTKWVLKELEEKEQIWLSSYLEGLSSLSQKELMDFAMRDRLLIAKLHSSQILQSQFQWVVALAAESQTFRRILNEVTSDEIGKLSSLVVTSKSVLPPQVFSHMVDSGQFEENPCPSQAGVRYLTGPKGPECGDRMG